MLFVICGVFFQAYFLESHFVFYAFLLDILIFKPFWLTSAIAN